MSFRRSGPSARSAISRVITTSQRSHFDALEKRQLLAAAIGHTVDSITGIVESPTLVPLSNVSAKSKALISAGAKLFENVSNVAARNGATQYVNAAEFTPFNVKLDSLKTLLANAPLEFTAAAKKPLVLALPNPDGGFSRFNVVEAPIMEAGLANKFSDIKTYRGIGVDDPTATVRLDYTQLGFHAQVLNGEKTFYIDPYYLNDAAGNYLSYYKEDLVRTSDDVFECELDSLAEGLGITDLDHDHEHDHDHSEETPALASLTYGGTLKTYRAAVGASYQYTAAVGGGTVAGGQAAIVTAMNRVTGVYETELATRMILVANNSSLVYATSTNSFVNDSSVINSSTSKISGIIGVANYDIGHVFTTASGGVAGLGVVGSSSSKGRGTTGRPSPVGDAFTIDYVAHEIGHQFAANHTFNVNNGQRNAGTAYEPGSGVSIMGYAGLEGNNDLALNSIPYFHAASIDEIRNFIGAISSVGTATSTGNTAPTVSAGADYVIPTGTHFALTATGSDPDGHPLTYDWQEMDLGPSNTLNSADNGTSPLFRPFTPSSSPTRVFPTLPNILLGRTTSGNYANSTTYVGERLPTVARTAMKFRVIARDNRVGGGGVSTDDMQIQVVNTGAAFAISNLNTATTLAGGSFQTITWNVAGTTGSGINTANVAISLSVNNGTSFPYVLAATTENDGSAEIQLPYGIGASTARIKVEAIGNIFFDINNAALSITNVPVPASAVPNQPLLLSDTGTSASDGITNRNNSSAGSVLDFEIGNTVAGAFVELLIDGTVVGSATATGTVTTISTDGVTTLSDGPHTYTARQTETGKPVSALATAGNVTIDSVAPTLASAPTFNFETGHSLTYVFGEADLGNFSNTAITVSDGTNTVPATVSYDSATLTSTITFGGLLANGDYTATLDASTITDVAGNALVAGSPLAFFVLAGDINRDRSVGFDDLLTLAQNYGTSGKTFSTGNINYDIDGNVDFDDLLLLAQAYGSSLPSLVAGGTTSSPSSSAKLATSSTKRRVASQVL